jgi:hypothetical protein
MNWKRLLVATGLGALLGIACIIGVSQRLPANPLPNAAIYLTGAWYTRLEMGVMIGLAGKLKLIKSPDHILNRIARGALFGAIASVGFAFFQQVASPLYFVAGIMFGVINDILTTRLVPSE